MLKNEKKKEACENLVNDTVAHTFNIARAEIRLQTHENINR